MENHPGKEEGTFGLFRLLGGEPFILPPIVALGGYCGFYALMWHALSINADSPSHARVPSGEFLVLPQPPYEPGRPPLWKISVQQAYFFIRGLYKSRNQGDLSLDRC